MNRLCKRIIYTMAGVPALLTGSVYASDGSVVEGETGMEQVRRFLSGLQGNKGVLIGLGATAVVSLLLIIILLFVCIGRTKPQNAGKKPTKEKRKKKPGKKEKKQKKQRDDAPGDPVPQDAGENAPGEITPAQIETPGQQKPPEEYRFCKVCGKRYLVGKRFCTQCGTPLE